jgi:DNA repair protein RadB
LIKLSLHFFFLQKKTCAKRKTISFGKPFLRKKRFIMQLPTKYSAGCKNIDELLGGGFESGTVTQLYGEAGSGKTNICLQTAVECARKGKTVIFIDSEGFSPERFLQIANAKPKPLQGSQGRETEPHSANTNTNTNETSETVERIAQRITIYEPHSFEQQTSCIDEIEDNLRAA